MNLPTTRWNVVHAAGQKAKPGCHEALSALYATYRAPVYTFVRGRGHSAEEARDLTQGFFARLVEKNDVAAADPTQGKFRNWLLTAVKRYLANDWDRAQAQKRGGGQPLLSIDATDAEGRCPLEPGHDTTPERLYERRWAINLLERALLKLRTEYVKRGQENLFEKLKPCLVGGSGELHRVIAEGLGMREKTFNTSVSRCQSRFNALIKAEIAETVGGEGEIEDEMRYLLSVLRSH